MALPSRGATALERIYDTLVSHIGVLPRLCILQHMRRALGKAFVRRSHIPMPNEAALDYNREATETHAERRVARPTAEHVARTSTHAMPERAVVLG